MGSVKGKLPMAWETAREVVGSHGMSDGEAANGLGNGRSGCWLLVVGSHGLSDGEAANRLGNGQGGCWFSWDE